MNSKIENLPPIVKGELLGKLSEIEIINMLRDHTITLAFDYFEDINDLTSRKTIYLYESDLLDILEMKILALRHNQKKDKTMIFKDFFTEIHHSEIYGDCTSDAVFVPKTKVTVRQLCEYILSQKGEWGYIKLADDPDMQVDYSHGEYVGDRRFPQSVMDSDIKRVEWRGGWTMAYLTITINGPKHED